MHLADLVHAVDRVPRWTAYDAKFYKLKDLDPKIPMVTQERAYTSAIWYTP